MDNPWAVRHFAFRNGTKNVIPKTGSHVVFTMITIFIVVQKNSALIQLIQQWSLTHLHLTREDWYNYHFVASCKILKTFTHISPSPSQVTLKYTVDSSPPDKMAIISQTVFSDAFSWMKSYFFTLISISLTFVPMGPIGNNTHWFR